MVITFRGHVFHFHTQSSSLVYSIIFVSVTLLDDKVGQMKIETFC